MTIESMNDKVLPMNNRIVLINRKVHWANAAVYLLLLFV